MAEWMKQRRRKRAMESSRPGRTGTALELLTAPERGPITAQFSLTRCHFARLYSVSSNPGPGPGSFLLSSLHDLPAHDQQAMPYRLSASLSAHSADVRLSLPPRAIPSAHSS